MKLARRPLPFVSLLAAAALLLPGCRDESTAPNQVSEQATAKAAGDRYIVVMKETRGVTTMAAPSADVARLGGRIERAHAGIGVYQVRGGANVAAELRKRPDVEAVVKDRTVQWLPPSRVTASQKFRANSNQRGAQFFDVFQWNIKKIFAQRAWNVSNQGAGVTVCVLDSGIDPRHIDLEGKLDLGISASFVANERADRDFRGHGTYMASIITSNGIGVASVAPDARVCSVKVLDRNGSGNFGDVITALMYVGELRIDVVNMSFGALVPRNAPGVQPLVRALQRAANFAANRGVLMVASAGNESANLNNPDLISIPAQLDHVISVGATGPIGQRQFDHVASYSNIGRAGVDVFAPGGEDVFPANVLQDLILGACSASFRGPIACDDGITFFFADGTSQSAAHVTGEAAVIEAELPGDQTPAELTACILRTADPLPLPNRTANGRINVFEGQACNAS